MKKRSRFYPRLTVDTADVPAVGQAGGVLLTDTVAAAADPSTTSWSTRAGSRFRGRSPAATATTSPS